MNIKTECTPGGWTAIDLHSYDGPGSPVGHGLTAEEAESNLLEALGEDQPSSELSNELIDVIVDIGSVFLPGSLMRQQAD